MKKFKNEANDLRLSMKFELRWIELNEMNNTTIFSKLFE